ncbi:hypothetical protein SAMN02745163_02821 [Clostridium cavendishii DSM 21758]|uniref:Uncharacterized protein n=1 Tax=Clostridium cavendishii DSM 21758 TaxID=1121302 RepID=A0A1M6N7Y4_9CLOT|nr:hypothetical protein [Clostridium cavendishii]SHJ91858.1 hypothetical protein SAMN02745163_02821 [Clostridium cavendishii DSM 21758]
MNNQYQNKNTTMGTPYQSSNLSPYGSTYNPYSTSTSTTGGNTGTNTSTSSQTGVTGTTSTSMNQAPGSQQGTTISGTMGGTTGGVGTSTQGGMGSSSTGSMGSSIQGTSKGSSTYSTGSGSTNDMSFSQFDHNYSMQSGQQGMYPNATYPSVESINEFFKKFLKMDITKIPFIPNPYYMANMKQKMGSTTNGSSDMSNQAERQHQMQGYYHMPMYNYPNMSYPSHGYHDMHNSPYHQHKQPYYDHHYMYPVYDYDHHYYGSEINPFTWLLLSSMFREY